MITKLQNELERVEAISVLKLSLLSLRTRLALGSVLSGIAPAGSVWTVLSLASWNCLGLTGDADDLWQSGHDPANILSSSSAPPSRFMYLLNVRCEADAIGLNVLICGFLAL
jgi:hypothetical protein